MNEQLNKGHSAKTLTLTKHMLPFPSLAKMMVYITKGRAPATVVDYFIRMLSHIDPPQTV